MRKGQGSPTSLHRVCHLIWLSDTVLNGRIPLTSHHLIIRLFPSTSTIYNGILKLNYQSEHPAPHVIADRGLWMQKRILAQTLQSLSEKNLYRIFLRGSFWWWHIYCCRMEWIGSEYSTENFIYQTPPTRLDLMKIWLKYWRQLGIFGINRTSRLQNFHWFIILIIRFVAEKDQNIWRQIKLPVLYILNLVAVK